MRKLLLSTVTIGLVALSACSPQKPAVEEAPKQAEATHGAHWTYAGQAEWGGLCSTGATQSPIALVSAKEKADLPDLVTTYAAGAGALINNGHTLQFTPATPGALKIGADGYALAQFHFHAPSEHTLDGASFPVELHFVNKNEAGDLAVVGVFIEPGAANAGIAALLAALPANTDPASATNPTVDPALLLPAGRQYFAYSGSLTTPTPDCKEGVRWNVLKAPIQASTEQIAALQTALGPSNRGVQALNGRQLAFGE
jgi:carbonic anhydrase